MDQLGVIIIALAVMVWLVTVAYFNHRENMRRLDSASSDMLTRLEVIQLRMRERWRMRWGILVGTLVLASGIAVLTGLTIAYPHGPGSMSDPGTFAGFAGFGVFLLVAGVTILIANIVWSRKGPTIPTEYLSGAIAPDEKGSEP